MERRGQMQDFGEQNGRLVLKNTFFEVMEDSSPSHSGQGLLHRASSDPGFYEGRPRSSSEITEDDVPQNGEKPDEKDVEFELTGFDLSDTETDPGRARGRSLPMPCYQHLKEAPVSGATTPEDREPGIFSSTPEGSPGAQNRDELPTLLDPLQQSASLRGTAPVPCPSASAAPEPATKQDLDRLAAQVAQLAKENELLRQRVAEQSENEILRQRVADQSAPVRHGQQEPMPWVNADVQWWLPVNFNVNYCGGMPMGSTVYHEHQEHIEQREHQPQAGARAAASEAQKSRSRRQRGQNTAGCSTGGRVIPAGPVGVGGWADEAQAAPQIQGEARINPISAGTSVKAQPGGKNSKNVPLTDVPCDLPLEQCTTVMLRNLPNNYSRAMLLTMLDDEGFAGQYNFLYLPMDFQSRACLGYAFVNLVDPSVVPRFWSTFLGYSKWVLPSKKVCGVSWSGPHQGLEAHVERYRNSPVMHATVPDEYKPVVFQGCVRVEFPPPTKVPRPPRVRNHADFQAHWSTTNGQIKTQPSRMVSKATGVPTAAWAQNTSLWTGCAA